MYISYRIKNLSLACLIFLLFCLPLAIAQDDVEIKVEDIDVKIVKVGSGKPYKVGEGGLKINTVYYIDRTYVVTAMPEEMIGATFIMTGNDDKSSVGLDFLQLEVKDPVLVWLARDSRGDPGKGGQTPAWLSEDEGWIRHEDMIIEVTDTNMGHFVLWHKEFPKGGEIVLGGNAEPPSAGQGSMYIVLLTAGKALAVKPAGKLGAQWGKLKINNSVVNE